VKHHFSGFILDTDARQLLLENQTVHLTPKAFELLEILIAERPRAVAKHDLYDRLWPDTYVVDANLPVLIREIRTALGDRGRSMIRTVQRFGYAFGVELTPASVHLLVQGDRQFPLAPGENVLGRDPKADVTIASTTVSRRHAIITIEGNEATLVDLQSKNGTRVAGREVVEPVALFDGAVIQVGRVEVTYRCPTAQGDTETARGA
jgi:DNA-binding winged helix-turn-helix (wHTH) protein